MKKLPSLSVVFPAYNDEHSIPILVKKTADLLPSLAKEYEVIVVNDASTDNTRQQLSLLQQTFPFLKVVTHTRNRGYGGALLHGFKKASKEWIFYTDGDGQYDVRELPKLVFALDKEIDMVTGFKLARSDSTTRKLVGAVYNQFVKAAFGINTRDVDCDFRLFRKNILNKMQFTIKSGVFDAEFMWQCRKHNVRIKEIPVHHYARPFGSSQFFTIPRLVQSTRDLCLFWFRTRHL